MLSLLEELILLAIEDDGSVAQTAGAPGFGMALVGAALIQLNQRGRIDADVHRLHVLSSESTGEPAEDWVLERLARGAERGIGDWVAGLFPEARELARLGLARLCERGVLAREERRFLWVLRTRRYPLIEGREQQEAKMRIATSLLGEELPTPHDAALIGLAAAGGLLEAFLSKAEIARLEQKAERIGDLDLIVLRVRNAIHEEKVARARAAMMMPQ